MTLSEWLSLSLICLLGASSPGPSLMVILTATTKAGRTGGILASLTHGFGIFIYALASATGLSIILLEYQQLFVLIQMAGAALLGWMGYRSIASALSPEQAEPPSPAGKSSERAQQAVNGFLIAILNPKIAVFFISLFSQFLDVHQSISLSLKMAVLAGSIDSLWYILIVFIASTSVFNRLMYDYARVRDGLFGCILIILSLSLWVPSVISFIF